MSTLGKMVASVEFALIARVCAVAAVIIGFFATVALALATMILTDMRSDVKETATLARRLDTAVQVQDGRLGRLERTVEKIDAAVFPWNQPQPRDPASVRPYLR